MSAARTILVKCLVKPFYRQNAGLLTFFLFMMLGAVGRANEAGLLEYHYALMRGMLMNPTILILVCAAWFLYAKKCEQFVAHTIRRQDFSFLNLLSQMESKRAYRLLLYIQLLLFLPVILYALVVAGVGFYNQWHLQVILMLLYNLVLCSAIAAWWLYLVQNPGTTPSFLRWWIPSLYWERFYWSLFIRYILTDRKLLFFVTKIYSCGILYLMVVNLTPADYDLSMILLFFSFGILGHGIIIHQLRAMEEVRLGFYRGMPVSLLKRYLQYALLYFLLFIPEIIIIGRLAPVNLHYDKAFLFIFFGYSILLFLNSILFIRFFRRVDYLKIIVGIFFIIFIGILTGTVLWISVLAFILSVYIFIKGYYRFER